MIKIVVAEDQVILRESLENTLNAEEDLEVVGAVSSATDALDVIAKASADVALFDVCDEKGASGIEAAKQLLQKMPWVKVVIMTGMPEVTFISQAKDAGVHSFVYKNIGTEELVSIIRSTFKGYSIYPNEVKSVFSVAAKLTQTEIDILRLVCEAKSRKEVAAELFMSESTVKRHITEILAKTGYDSILKLAVHAVSQGLIVPNNNSIASEN